jgi:hypothetical protein
MFSVAPANHFGTTKVLVYRSDEYSFDVEPPSRNGSASVLVNDINLELDETGRVVSLWGLCPHTRWRPKKLVTPASIQGQAQFNGSDMPLRVGESVRLNKDAWPVFVDTNSGWVSLDGGRTASRFIESLAHVLLGLDSNGDIVSLWLKPLKLPPAFMMGVEGRAH